MDKLKEFADILKKYPGISANSYDRLKEKKPSRPWLMQKYKTSWLGLVKMVGTGTLKDSQVDRNAEGVYQKFHSKTGEVSINSRTIVSLEEALAIAEVDLEQWEVDRWHKNSWPVTMKVKRGDHEEVVQITMHQVKIFFKARQKLNLYLGIKQFVEKAPKLNFKISKAKQNKTGIAAEVALIDSHIGKLAWSRETGRPDYDLKISVKDYLNAFDQNMTWIAPFKPEKIFYIVGQDLFHIENFEATTFRGGYHLDADSRLPKVYRQGMETVVRCVKSAADVAPVEVIWIPGNHDLHASLFLCMLIEKLFENNKRISVDVSEQQRKARLWGSLLVGWTHEIKGRQNAWINELAQAFPEQWGKSKFRELHYGHLHRKNETKTSPVLTQGGVLMRQITALSPIDKWHYDYLFTDAVPGGESFLWSKDQGIFANFVAWTNR